MDLPLAIPAINKTNYSKRSPRHFKESREDKKSNDNIQFNIIDGLEELTINFMLGCTPATVSKKKSKHNQLSGVEIIIYLRNNANENLQKKEKENSNFFYEIASQLVRQGVIETVQISKSSGHGNEEFQEKGSYQIKIPYINFQKYKVENLLFPFINSEYKIFVVRDENNNKYLVKKVLKTAEQGCARLKQEALNLTKIKKLNVNIFPKVKYFYQTNTSYVLLQQYPEGGNLFERLIHEEKISNKLLVSMLLKIVQNLHQLHENDYLLLNLHLGCIYLSKIELDEKTQFFFIDSEYLHYVGSSASTSVDCISFNSDDLPKLSIFSPPEYLQSQVHKNSDMWSLGIYFYWILFGYPPFFSNKIEHLQKLVQNYSFFLPKVKQNRISPMSRVILLQLLHANPLRRVASGELLNYPLTMNKLEQINVIIQYPSYYWRSIGLYRSIESAHQPLIIQENEKERRRFRSLIGFSSKTKVIAKQYFDIAITSNSRSLTDKFVSELLPLSNIEQIDRYTYFHEASSCSIRIHILDIDYLHYWQPFYDQIFHIFFVIDLKEISKNKLNGTKESLGFQKSMDTFQLLHTSKYFADKLLPSAANIPITLLFTQQDYLNKILRSQRIKDNFPGSNASDFTTSKAVEIIFQLFTTIINIAPVPRSIKYKSYSSGDKQLILDSFVTTCTEYSSKQTQSDNQVLLDINAILQRCVQLKFSRINIGHSYQVRKLSHPMLTSLCDYIKVKQCPLLELNLHKLKIKNKLLIELFDSLAFNQSIKLLNLSSNQINDTQVIHLCTKLQYHPALEEMILINNKITSEGVINISKLLVTLFEIKCLDVSMNPINDDGIYYLCESIQFCYSFRYLYISDCLTSEVSLLSIIKLLASHPIELIHYQKNIIPPSYLPLLSHAISSNPIYSSNTNHPSTFLGNPPATPSSNLDHSMPSPISSSNLANSSNIFCKLFIDDHIIDDRSLSRTLATKQYNLLLKQHYYQQLLSVSTSSSSNTLASSLGMPPSSIQTPATSSPNPALSSSSPVRPLFRRNVPVKASASNPLTSSTQPSDLTIGLKGSPSHLKKTIKSSGQRIGDHKQATQASSSLTTLASPRTFAPDIYTHSSPSSNTPPSTSTGTTSTTITITHPTSPNSPARVSSFTSLKDFLLPSSSSLNDDQSTSLLKEQPQAGAGNMPQYLSNNQVVPQKLQQLDLSSLKMRKLPESMGVLKELRVLNLYNNQLRTNHSSNMYLLSKLKHLEELYLAKNHITNLLFISDLVKLRVLDVRWNEIGNLDSFSEYRELEQLYLDSNYLLKIPLSILSLPKIKYFSVYNNSLPWIKSIIYNYWSRDMRQLDLHKLELKYLPKEIALLSNLFELNVSYNELTYLPPQLGQLSNLKIIDLSYNHLLNDDQLQPLYPLDLSVLLITGNNKLSSNILNSTQPLQSIRDYFNTMYNQHHPPSSSSSSQSQPSQSSTNSSSNVNAFANQCSASTSSSGTVLNNLTYLVEFPRAKLMIVGGPKVGKTILSKMLRNRTKPKKKMQNSNPSASSTASSSTTLNNTALSNSLNNLTVSNNSNNPPSNTPSSSTPSSSNASSNATTVQLSNTENIIFNNVNNTNTPYQPSSRNTNHVNLQYIQNHTSSISYFKNRSKKRESLNEYRETDGIKIHHWVADPKSNPPVEFSVWDLAGGDVYQTTHAFFLEERSIYLLVFDLTANEGKNKMKINYWLQMINAAAPKSPIILVGTHVDELSEAEIKQITDNIIHSYSSLQLRVEIKAIFTINTFDQEHIESLHDSLLQILRQQPYLSKKVPSGYLQLIDQIQAERTLSNPPFVSMVEFEQMVLACKIDSSAQTVAELLNLCGIISYFNDKKLGVAGSVVLDPTWLIDLISTLITTKSNGYIENGILNHNYLNDIWKNYPLSLQPFLLGLFNKIELIYTYTGQTNPNQKGRTGSTIKDEESNAEDSPTAGNKVKSRKSLKFKESEALLKSSEYSIIPSTFPRHKPPAVQSHFNDDYLVLRKGTQLERIYKFEFHPFGFFSRLIVRMLHFTTPICYWYTGLLCESGEQTGLIEFELGNELSVKVRGKNPAKLLRSIVENIDLLLAGWYQNKPTVIVPFMKKGENYRLVVDQNVDKIVDYNFPLEELEQAAALGKEAVEFKYGNGKEELMELIRIDSIAPDLVLADISEMLCKWSDLQVEKQIGQGAFGIVYSAIYNGEKVAVKQLEVENNMKTEVYREFRREVALCCELKQDSIVGLRAVCLDPWALVMEFMPYGDLYSFLGNKNNFINWRMILKMAQNIAEAICFLHSFQPKIIHRDLKSPNCLVSISSFPPSPSPLPPLPLHLLPY